MRLFVFASLLTPKYKRTFLPSKSTPGWKTDQKHKAKAFVDAMDANHKEHEEK